MAGRIIDRIALACVLVALIACAQTSTKSDTEKIDLTKIYALATQAYAEKNWPESEQHYATLTRKSPGEAEPWFKLGNIYARTFRPELAVKFYREALVRDPANVKAWHNLGIIELRQAANTFATLQDLLEPGDVLYEKSVTIQTSINALVN